MANRNSFKTQSLVANTFAFKFDEQPGIIERLKWDSDAAKKIGAVNRTGGSTSLLRPSRVTPTLTTLGTDYSLTGVTQPPVGYQQISDPVVPLTVDVRAEINLQTSIEELSLNRTPEAIKQYVSEYVTIFRNKIEADLIKKVIVRVGQSVTQSQTVTAGLRDYATNFIEALGNGRAGMIARGATTTNARDLTFLVNPFVAPKIGSSGSKEFSFGNGFGASQASGNIQRNLAGFDIYESPLMYSLTLPAQWTGTTTGSAVGFDGAADLATDPAGSGYVETQDIILAGVPANQVIQAGTILTIAGVGNWTNQDTGYDTGVAATVVVTKSVTASAGGAATVTTKEALIVSGPYRNVTNSAAVASGAAVTMVGAASGATATINPGLGFSSSAIIPVSPKIVVPSGAKIIAEMSFDSGVKVVMIEDHWPGTVQGIIKILGFYGASVVRPEAAFVHYGA